MASKTKKKSSKSNSKFRKFIQNFDPKSRKGMLLLFLFSFALVGGGYAAYKTFAASYPPDSYRKYIVTRSKATDGITGDMWCLSTAAKTLVGPLAPCVQYNPASPSTSPTARLVTYSTAARNYTPTTAWVKTPVYGKGAWDLSKSIPATKCRNVDYYFLGNWPMLDIFGLRSFGWIYRIGSYSTRGVTWQVKNANMDSVGNCSSSGIWYNAGTWDNIQTN